MYIIIGLGDEVGATSKLGRTLQTLACDAGGIFQSVPDSSGDKLAVQALNPTPNINPLNPTPRTPNPKPNTLYDQSFVDD